MCVHSPAERPSITHRPRPAQGPVPHAIPSPIERRDGDLEAGPPSRRTGAEIEAAEIEAAEVRRSSGRRAAGVRCSNGRPTPYAAFSTASGAAGSRTQNVLPCPSTLLTPTWPPCSSVIRLTR